MWINDSHDRYYKYWLERVCKNKSSVWLGKDSKKV